MSIEINGDAPHDGIKGKLLGSTRFSEFVQAEGAMSKTLDPDLLSVKQLKSLGMPHSKCISSQQNFHWEAIPILEYFPLFSATIAACLCIGLISRGNWSTGNYIKYVLCSLYLIFLSSLKVPKLKYFSEITSAALIVISIIEMESVLSQKQCLASYLTFLVAYRIMYHKSFFDNFAICLSYTVVVGAINGTNQATDWYIASNVLIWTYFLVALLLLYVFKRVYLRLWEHVRIMMIVKEKIAQEQNIGEALLAAHVPDDILSCLKLQSSLPVQERCFLQGTPVAHTDIVDAINKQDPGHSPRDAVAPHLNTDDVDTETLLLTARQLGLLPAYTEAQLSLDLLQSVKGFDRKECAVIAIGFDSSSDGAGDSGRGPQGDQALHALLDKLAATHRVTCVRKFGNVWLGCVGFFKTWESPSVNSYEALLFACEASFLLSKFASRTTFAVDCGTITGGYLNSLNFDLFGQEVRWLLMALELKQYGKVIVGEAAQKAHHAHSRAVPGSVAFKTTATKMHIPWDVSNDITVHCVENVNDVVDLDALSQTENTALHQDPAVAVPAEDNSPAAGSVTVPHSAVTSKTVSFCDPAPSRTVRPINWKMLQTLLHEREPPAERWDDRQRPSKHTKRNDGLWSIHDNGPTFDQEIGEEFLLSTMDRFHLCVTDPILDKMSAKDLIEAHAQTERNLIAGVRKVCFPTIWRYCWLSSSYTDTAGKNEYKSLMIDAKFFRSEWYAGPLLALFGGTFLEPYLKKISITHLSVPSSPNESIPPESQPQGQVAAPQFKRKTKYKKMRHAEIKVNASRVAPIAEADGEDISPMLEVEPNELGSAGGVPAAVTVVSTPPVAVSSAPTSIAAPLAVKVKPTNVAVQVTASSDQRGESLRSWTKYAGDIRLFFYEERWNGLVTLVFFGVQIYALDGSMEIPGKQKYPSMFLFFIVCILGLLLLFERRYDAYSRGFIMLLIMACGFILPDQSRCLHSSYHNSGPVEEYGDLGGDVNTNLFFLPLIPIHMRQDVGFSIVSMVLLRVAQSLNKLIFEGDCSKATFVRYPVLALALLWTLYFWALQFSAYTLYILEHKLLPTAVKSYRKQKANSRALLHAFAQDVPSSTSCELFVQKSYRQCAIAALHITASDQLAQFLEPKDFSLVLGRIYQVIEKCIAECGMLSVTHFSGVFLAAACKDCAWDSVESLRFPDTHTARTVVLLRRVRAQLAALSRELKFSIQLGIGIDQGPVQLGFLGQLRFCYDISGPARDLAVAMSSFHGAGTFANEAFDSDIRKMQAPEDIIRDVTSLLEPSRVNGSRWLRIDGSFNGIQLEDFKYLCLLGQGGYGSVHLLAEKHTGVPYAIKAIELKQESKLSKMIERECSILQMIQHPNVVNLKYSFRNHNRLYLVMSYIRGGNLKQVIDRDNLDLPHMIPWFAELVLAIEYLHSMGIIHRDVKPANCMIGTDGHLKLADFGLSKVVIADKETATFSKETATQASVMGLTYEAYQKMRKFFPLKIDAAQKDDAAESTMHRTIRILLITMDDDKADSTLLFINTTVEIIIADYDIDSDTIRATEFEAIFIDGDYYEEDGVELVKHFCSMLLNGIPVLMIAKDEERRQRGLKAGARACSRLPLEALNEDMFDILFGPEPDHLFADPLKHCLVDIMQLQEEKAAPGVQDAPGESQRYVDALHMSKHRTADLVSESIKNKTGGGKDIVAVESRSHSLVGTLHFIAPEVVKIHKYGKAVDWWACGVTFYQCATRKHLFKGEEKKDVLEQIIHAPIDLTLLQPLGEAIVTLVKGLLCRDIKKRLGSQSIEAIKSQKVFEKIDWATVSTGNPVHRPAQFVNRKFRAEDKDLFYGPRGNFDLRRENLEDKNTTSMQKYLLNKKRAKMRGSSNSRNGSGNWASGRKSLSGSSKIGLGKSDRDSLSLKNKSRSVSNSKGSSSLELVVESLHEVHEEL